MFDQIRQKTKPVYTSGEVFPQVDYDELRNELRPESRGLENGRTGHPPPDAVDLDPVEKQMVAAVRKIRQRGLGEAAEHDRVYRERIAAETGSGSGIQQIANDAETDFRSDVDKWRVQLTAARDDLRRSLLDLEEFRQNNNLHRSAHESAGFLGWFAWCSVIILAESALNGVFFSAEHVAGLLGGSITALVIAVVNVGAASIAGHVFRQKNHARFTRRFTGWLFLACGVGLAVFINFLVGHFRDLTAIVEWDQAAGDAVKRLAAGQWQMQSLDAWLLTGLGLLIAAFSGWKAYGAFDPYPGYSHVSERCGRMRQEWQNLRQEAFDALLHTRDEAKDSLKEERAKISERFETARSAREGFSVLASRRRAFLQDCDQVAGDLLSAYRDANRKARAEPEPGYFRERFSFPAETEPVEPSPQSLNAVQQADDTVKEAEERIHRMCKDAMDEFNEEGGRGK